MGFKQNGVINFESESLSSLRTAALHVMWCVLEGQEEGRREGQGWVVWAWVVCVGERREEEGGRRREGSVMQVLSYLSHMLRI